MNNEISFSFLPLTSSNFSFEIYRRAVEGEKSQDEYRYNLPLNNEQKDIRDDFFVSFMPRDGSIKYICNSLDNISIATQHPDSQIVGIFAGIQKDFDDTQKYSPYYIIKNIFLKNGLAVQAVTIEQTLKRDGLKWSISGIGLQLFVKLGGIPWKVVPQNENCVIFGISSAHLRNDDGTIRKYYAYSVCFDSSGLYKRLDVLSTSDSQHSYMQSLKQHVSQTLQEQITNGITKCAIHVPFKLRKDEMECLRECANEFKQNHAEIEIVFIKINVENRFFGYSDYNSKIPLSGSYIELSDREILVWFEGLQQGKENLVTSQAITNPVHIQFLGTENLSKEQINSYLQDVINLSGANWRGYNAKHTPVSIYYPELIAKFIGRFDQYGLEMNLGLGAIDNKPAFPPAAVHNVIGKAEIGFSRLIGFIVLRLPPSRQLTALHTIYPRG